MRDHYRYVTPGLKRKHEQWIKKVEGERERWCLVA